MKVESALRRTTLVGGFGGTAAMMKLEANDGKLSPASLIATTWNM
jgi:hypothetical protein